MNRGSATDSKKIEWLAVALLVTLATVLRFWLLGFSPFRSDTMNFYQLALNGQGIMDLWKNPPWMSQMPVGEILSVLMVKLGLPPTPFVVRLPFAVMGVLALIFVWRFARRWFGPGAALLTLLLAALNPYQIYFSRTAYYYSGVICWSAALFLTFWSVWETLLRRQFPRTKQLILWCLTAIAACHMHMGVWIVAGLQVLLLGLSGLRLPKPLRTRFLVRWATAAAWVILPLVRWIIRAVQEALKVGAAKGTPIVASPAGPEFLRLLPAYFGGESIPAIALLLLFVALVILALVRATEDVGRLRALAWITVLHLVVQLLYIGIIGRGLAKISYFSAIWPPFILLMGIGSYKGIRTLPTRPLRTALASLLAGGYMALTVAPAWAIIHLEGKTTPYYKINDWIVSNLDPDTPVLTDRWFEPWNELAVHNAEDILYTFTIPDEPFEVYCQVNWPATVEDFFERHPDGAFLELSRGRYEKELGPWTFPEEHFARVASITNDAAMALSRMRVFPSDDFSSANSNRIVVRVFYNTRDDQIDLARRKGRDVLRLYNEDWTYSKPFWPEDRYEDYRTFKEEASIDLYNLKDTALSGAMEIYATAIPDHFKDVSVNGERSIFSPVQMQLWSIPMTLQPGHNHIPFSSPSSDPLMNLDIRWNSGDTNETPGKTTSAWE